MHRRQRRGRRRRGRGSGARGSRRRDRRGRSAAHVFRLPHAGVRGLSGSVSGVGRAKDRGQGDQHPAGTLRGRRHDGQLDKLVPHAGSHARALGARPSARRVLAERPRAVVRENGIAALDRTVGHSAEREQRNARTRRGSARHSVRDDPAQRAGLREPRLLRRRLSVECEAIDARHDDPRSARSRGHAGDARARNGSSSNAIASPRSNALPWMRPAARPERSA